MKSLKFIIILTIVSVSCESQSTFDLADLVLRGEKVNSILPKDAKPKVTKLGQNGETEYMTIRSEKLMNFNGINLAGTLNPETGKSKNRVSLYFEKDSLIYKYEITIFTTDEGTNLVDTIKKKLGEPSYYSYRSAEDKSANNFQALLWEDQTNNRLYRLNYSLDETVKVRLEVTENNISIEDLNLISPFSYWEDYLTKRKENKSYTYQQFLTDETNDDPENSYKKYTN